MTQRVDPQPDTRPTRRGFLVQTDSAGALVLGRQVPASVMNPARAQAPAAPGGSEINLWVVVHPDERCVVRIARSQMGTGGCRGIRTSHDDVRRGGAAARLMLLQAAANDWQVPMAELRTAAGVITHAASGRRTTYGQVAGAASRLPAPDPKSLTLKDPKTWTVAGLPKKRLDTRNKLDGSKV